MKKLSTWEPKSVYIIQSTRDSANCLTIPEKATSLLEAFGESFNLADKFRLGMIAESKNATLNDLEFVDSVIKKYRLTDGITEVEATTK